jgi:hypothetical protein
MKPNSKMKVIRKPKRQPPKRKVNEITKDLKAKQVYHLTDYPDELDEFDAQHVWPL